MPPLNEELRDYFDTLVQRVLAGLPDSVQGMLQDTPLYVEDYPSPSILKEFGMRRRDALCGLYTGIPITQRSVAHSGIPSDVIHIFREGILAMSRDRRGKIDERRLCEQIRITILHELGHLHGLSERDLGELGYG